MNQENKKSPSNYYKYSEYLWLCVAIAAILWASYIAVSDSFKVAKGYFIMSSIPVGYYFVKRFFRKRAEKQYEKHNKK